MLTRLKLSVKNFMAFSFSQTMVLRIEIASWLRGLFWLLQYLASFFINFFDATLDERFLTVLLVNLLYDDL